MGGEEKENWSTIKIRKKFDLNVSKETWIYKQ